MINDKCFIYKSNKGHTFIKHIELNLACTKSFVKQYKNDIVKSNTS